MNFELLLPNQPVRICKKREAKRGPGEALRQNPQGEGTGLTGNGFNY